MISIPSVSATTFRRLLPLVWALLLAHGAVCLAQEPVSPDASARSSSPAAQQSPLQIVRPMERQQAPWRGVPWIGDAGQAAILVPEPLAVAPNHPRWKGDATDDNALRVSGWWTIDVKNPDGSTAVHREVENDYVPGPFLVFLLAGKLVPGEAMINFVTNGSDSSAGSPCLGTSGCQLSENPSGSWVSQSNCTQNPGSCSTNLTRSITNVALNLYAYCASFGGCITVLADVPALEFNGSITAQVNNNIGHLESHFNTCSESGAYSNSATTALNPANCIAGTPFPGATAGATYNSQAYPMTTLDLANPISVSAGQVVTIKLDLSFYSLLTQDNN